MNRFAMNRLLIFFSIIFILFVFSSCTYKIIINTEPEDAKIIVNSVEVESTKAFFSKTKQLNIIIKKEGYKEYKKIFEAKPFLKNIIDIKLEKLVFNVKIVVDEGVSSVYYGEKFIGNTPVEYQFEYGIHKLILKRENYSDQICHLDVKENSSITFHHHKESTFFEEIGVFPCGSQPKQVIFSPDDNQIFIPLLDGYGCDVFDIIAKKVIKTIKPDKKWEKKGFVEGIFIKNLNIFFVSQMTTNKIHQFDYNTLTFQKSIDTAGSWSKFIAFSDRLNILAISNWLSNTVSIIDINTGKVKNIIKTAPVPRGLAFTKDGKYLVVACFEGSRISLYDTDKWKEEKYIEVKGSAMRHIVFNEDDSLLYVSDMARSFIYEISFDDFKIIKEFKVYEKPNTIDISADGRFLAVSCRGPNNPESYLKRSLENGKIVIIDLLNKKEVARFTAGNQPTGLDFSNIGNFLCFSNFLDNTIELFWCKK